MKPRTPRRRALSPTTPPERGPGTLLDTAPANPPEPAAPWRLSFHRDDGTAWRARVHGPGGFALDFSSPFELARWCMAQAHQESAEARQRSGHSSLR